MQIIVLGSAAGGGFPQWNCNCSNCAGVRAGTIVATPRTQSSIIAGSDEGSDWILLNASPDVLEQIRHTPVLQPNRGIRDSGIAGVIRVDGQIDHATGLFMLRERGSPMPIWCTDPVYEDLTTGNPVLKVLQHYCGVQRQRIPLDGSVFRLDAVAQIDLRALPLSSKAAPYSPHREQSVEGDNVGLTLTDRQSGRSVFYAPGLGVRDERVFAAMRRADVVMVDGTFWTDDEMIRLGLSRKHARDIGHLPQSGDGGMIDWLDQLPSTTRKILIHINNTNPILNEASPERAQLARHGIEVACDGMRISV